MLFPRLRLLAAAVVLLLLTYLGARGAGAAPPLGGFLEPANGVWALARSANLPANAEARIPGLTAPVEVVYDDRGVPHVFAQTEEDAWRAQGYVVARDRLFQMELQTRAAAGTHRQSIAMKPGADMPVAADMRQPKVTGATSSVLHGIRRRAGARESPGARRAAAG